MKNQNKPKKLLILSATVLILVFSLVAVALATPRSASPYNKFSTFARVLTNIERNYVENVNGEQLIEGAIKGMIRTLDPHSSYLTKEDFKILKEDTSGNFGGVGLEVGVKKDIMTVISPISESPAEAAGIEPGDLIIKIEGISTRNMTIDESIRLMRGKTGTEVTITVQRKGEPESFDVSMTRAVIHVESVVSELLAPGFPRVWIRGFQDGTAADVKRAIDRLSVEGGGLEGILLDMRRNPGGLLEEAVRVSDLFIESGAIVTTKGRDGTVLNDYKARRRGTITDIPLVVLVDGASASAAEIVAGAIQDHGRGLLVGMQSFGKGSVQSIIPLDKGSGLKLTVALYYTPTGRAIQASGITPDVIVESRNAPTPDEETAILQKAPDERELPGHLDPQNLSENQEAEPVISDYQLRMAFQILRGTARARSAGAPGN